MRLLPALLLCLCLTAQADTEDRAKAAALGDVGSSAVGIALGAAESNPLGLALIPLKLIVLDYADGLPTGEREATQIAISTIWNGATANNLCVITVILTGGASAPACVFLGIAVAVQQWQSAQDEMLFWSICADERTRNPALVCNWSNDD